MAAQLWMLRHGEAEAHGTRPDSERRLTQRGERQSRLAGRAMVALGASIDAVLSSPKVRARDTAQLAAQAWDATPQLLAELAGGYDASQVPQLLAYGGVDGRVLIVGHEPDLSSLVAQLTGARIDFKKGGIAVVGIRGGGGELLALLRPREIAVLAGDGDGEELDGD